MLVVVALVAILAVVLGGWFEHTSERRLAESAAARVAAGSSIGSLQTRPLRVVATVEEPTTEALTRSAWQWRPTSSTVLFWLLCIGYLTVGAVLVLHFHSTIGDSVSRVANAWYVLFTRDPHLAAIGFVWNPLPSLLEMPLLGLKSIWPALAGRAFAGVLVSAPFMAGAVVQLRKTLCEWSTPTVAAWVLVAAVALNPMIVYYGANGMSEAPYVFFLVVTVRYLSRWIVGRHVRDLVLGGMALAFGYLVRYEFAATAATGAAVVFLCSYRRAVGDRKPRLVAAFSESAVYAVPFAVTFTGWALVSKVITGVAFPQLSGDTGNAALIKLAGGISTKTLGVPLPVYASRQILALGPLLPIIAVAVVVTAVRRRDSRALALATLAIVVVFNFVTFMQGGLFPWFRYYLPVVPLCALGIGLLLARPLDEARRRYPRARSVSERLLAAGLAVVLAVAGTATTAAAMNRKTFAPEEHRYMMWVFGGHIDSEQRAQSHLTASAASIARKLDARGLRNGAVLTDTFLPCVQLMVMSSEHPHQFVVASDRDFERAVADPKVFKVQYLLVPSAAGAADSLRNRYPGLYETGGGFSKLVETYHEPGCPDLRLYQVQRTTANITPAPAPSAA